MSMNDVWMIQPSKIVGINYEGLFHFKKRIDWKFFGGYLPLQLKIVEPPAPNFTF